MNSFNILIILLQALQQGESLFVCPAGAGNYADPTSCSKYYSCFFGSAVSQSCPAGTLWNDAMKLCDWPANVICSTSTVSTAKTTPATTIRTSKTTTATTKATTATTKVTPTTKSSTTIHSAITTTKSAIGTTKTTKTSSVTSVTKTSAGSTGRCGRMITQTSSWSGGYGATLNIPTPAAVASYTINLTTDKPVSSIQFWDANVTPSSGSSFTVTPKSWFGGAGAGSTLALGLQVLYTGVSAPSFISIKFNDGVTGSKELCGTASSSTTISPTGGSTTSSPPGSTTTLKVTTTTPAGSTGSPGCNKKRVVCYFPNWTYYRQGLGAYSVSNIDASLCTHFIYAFAVLDGTTYTMSVYDTWVDIDLQSYAKFVSLRAKYPDKKFLIALGGWNDSRTTKYSTLLADPTKRANFVKNAIAFLAKYGFDGLDLDYEYPAYGTSASEKSTFAAWVRELKTAFLPYGYELTAAVGAGQSTIDAGYDVPTLSQYLDAIHLMTYDMHGSWESMVNHHAPLYSPAGDTLSVDFAVKYWISKGADRSKLVVGIPTYGRSWTLSSSATSTGSPASGAGAAGSITAEAGFLGYQEICLNKNWTVVQDPTGQRGPYAYSGNQWVGYDDPNMASIKARYILTNQLGGAMFWDLPSDDFNKRCGGAAYPIISAVGAIITKGSC